MSRRTREPRESHDLFSVAGMSDQALPETTHRKSTPSAAKGVREAQKKANPRTVSEEVSNERYLRDTDVAQRYGVSRQTVWRWTAKGTLPEPSKLSEGVTRWRMSDLAAHEAALPKGAKTKVVRPRRVSSTTAGDQQ